MKRSHHAKSLYLEGVVECLLGCNSIDAHAMQEKYLIKLQLIEKIKFYFLSSFSKIMLLNTSFSNYLLSKVESFCGCFYCLCTSGSRKMCIYMYNCSNYIFTPSKINILLDQLYKKINIIVNILDLV